MSDDENGKPVLNVDELSLSLPVREANWPNEDDKLNEGLPR